jgi:hypothetical protein
MSILAMPIAMISRSLLKGGQYVEIVRFRARLPAGHGLYRDKLANVAQCHVIELIVTVKDLGSWYIEGESGQPDVPPDSDGKLENRVKLLNFMMVYVNEGSGRLMG